MKWTFNPFSGSLDAVQNLAGYVPYTGATDDVDLGDYKLSASEVDTYYFNEPTGFAVLGSASGAAYYDVGD